MKLAYFLKDATASGGMERVLSNKVAWWVAHGHEVHVVSVASPNGRPPFFPFAPEVRHHSLGLDVFYRRDLATKLSRRGNAATFIAATDTWLDTWKPDIAISMFDEHSRQLSRTSHSCIKVAELHFAKHKNKQYLFTLEENFLGRWLGQIYKHVELDLISRYDRFIVLTEQDRQAWGNLPNSLAIPNAQTFPATQQAPLQNNHVLALGRNTSQKRFDLLLRAWAMIAPRYPDARLSVIGPGDKRNLQGLARRLGITDQVHLGDAVNDVQALMHDASVLALSSQYEGFGMVLVEAMSCGVPVVATDCRSGPAEIVRHGEDGLLVRRGDAAAIAAAIDRLLGDQALRQRMGAAAFANVQRFAVDTVMQRWEQLFEQLLSSRG